MIYNNKEIQKLGFGLMRLPMLGEEVDIAQTQEMVDLFMANGFTYFDTAYLYLNQRSEGIAKQVLVDRYPRESFQIASKLPAWAVAKSKADAEQMLFTSLERAGVDYFDFYLLHNIGAERTKLFDDWDLWNFVLEQKAQGRIKNVGFSFHDNADALEKVLIAHPEMDFVQLQINYADWEDLTFQSKRCFDLAKAHGKPIVVMEPVRGGTLANPPQKVKAVLDAANPALSYAAWALKYVASKDNLITVLSGMSNMAQMAENVALMKDFTPLTSAEEVAIVQAQQVLRTIPSIPCTSCQYCVKDCPQGIKIPGILNAINKSVVYEDDKSAASAYGFATREMPDGGRHLASSCIGCKQCEQACPQCIPIVERLAQAVAMFE